LLNPGDPGGIRKVAKLSYIQISFFSRHTANGERGSDVTKVILIIDELISLSFILGSAAFYLTQCSYSGPTISPFLETTGFVSITLLRNKTLTKTHSKIFELQFVMLIFLKLQISYL
jgi:hypothetical protein